MSVTYEEARSVVCETLAPHWEDGTFCLDDRLIVEDDDLYLFNVGARELIEGGDESYARFGGAIAGVVKETGLVIWVPEVQVAARADSFRTRTNPFPSFAS
jgi:hypothetical protein